ncbi:MAG: efflux RND transporter periplasmic adaptor subunit [Betaproteobacteria bacterium]
MTQPTSTPNQTVAVPADLMDVREVRGQLSPRRYTTLAAEIPAKVLRMQPQEGGAFKVGQTLVSFDCAMQKSQLDKAKAAVKAASITLEANQEMIKHAAIGKVELEVSEAEAQKAQAEAKAAESVVSKCRVIAPFTGRVADQKVREEQFVQIGQALLEVIDDSVLELEFIAPSSWLSSLRTKGVVRVRVDETGKIYSARVARLGARVDPVSQSIKVVAVIDGRPSELMAGMSGRITLSQ